MRYGSFSILTCSLILALCDSALAQNNKKAPVANDDLAADMAKSAKSLRNFGIAFRNYTDSFQVFPSDIKDKEGKPLLSWRVALLPFLDENELYEQFKLDQPWDSKANMKLLEMMPAMYLSPRGKAEKGQTFYQSFAGPTALMRGKPVKDLADVTDGLAKTFMVVEAGAAVPWTKPVDLEFDDKKPFPKLGGVYGGDFHVLLGDGSVRFVKKDIREFVLKKYITIAGGETHKDNDLER